MENLSASNSFMIIAFDIVISVSSCLSKDVF